MSDEGDDSRSPYDVETSDEKFHVVDGNGRVIMVCGDAASAAHYAALMNTAFDRGYKSGYRDARKD